MDQILILGLITIILFIVFVQSVFLLPALNERVSIILSGQEAVASKHHIIFIVMEIVK
ncbi:MAG: hypothetical protein ACI94Y_001495 [Maribacter sp.]|jgi:hypothetical protein